MVNTLKNIEFSHGSLTYLSEQTEQVQNTILGAIFKAVVSDLSVLEHKRLEQMNNPYRAVLSVDEELRVVFRLDDDKIYVMDIVTADYFESFYKKFDKPREAGNNKKFNVEEMVHAFDVLNKMGTFDHIEDPVEWQKQSRKGWKNEPLLTPTY